MNEETLKNETGKPNGEPFCKIYFDNNRDGVYYAGQTMSGCAYLTLKEPISVRAIYAKITGEAYCSWTSGTSRRTSFNVKEQIYINKKIYFIGSENQSDRVTVQPGDYKYKFESDIPHECHTSLEAKIGSIHYSVIIVIEENADSPKEIEKSFTVLRELNLNDDKIFQWPISEETVLTYVRTKYCCFLCLWGMQSVKIRAKIPMRAYAPGQEIEITIIADNETDQKFEDFTASIYRNMEFYAGNRTYNTSEIITTTKCDGCPADQSVRRLLRITVPPTPPSEISSICTVSYILKVGAFADCCRDDPKFEFPITIGTYPIERTQTDGIIVTQLPTKPIVNETAEPIPNGASQSQPLLMNESTSSHQDLMSNLVTSQRKFDPPDFRVAQSNWSDKDLEGSFRPLYPVYRDRQRPLLRSLKVERLEVKPLKM